MALKSDKKQSPAGEAADDQRTKARVEVSPERENREAAERRDLDTERTLDDDERLELFQTALLQQTLPDPPKIPGYHLIWLTTTNPRDNIPMRLRLGYTPVKLEECPGWEHSTLKTGEWAGYIGVNEMLLFKLPLRLYERFMLEVHHKAPLREDEKLTATIDAIREQAQSKGGDVIEEGAGDNGFADLRKPVKAPSFINDELQA